MPLVNGTFYINPTFGRAVEGARRAESVSHEHQHQLDQDAHWVTIDGHHVLIQDGQNRPAPGANDSEQNQRRSSQRPSKTFSGEASYYQLPGRRTANGEKFDANKMAAAMTGEKAKLGQTVQVTYTYNNEDGKSVTRSIFVVVNDRGPFAWDASGKATRPLRPAPGRVIDLTPAAFIKLVGTTKPGHVPVTVTVPNE